MFRLFTCSPGKQQLDALGFVLVVDKRGLSVLSFLTLGQHITSPEFLLSQAKVELTERLRFMLILFRLQD